MASKYGFNNGNGHRPAREDGKDKGGNYGGARRADVGISENQTISPVKQALSDPANQSWQQRTSIDDVRANTASRGTGGWGK